MIVNSNANLDQLADHTAVGIDQKATKSQERALEVIEAIKAAVPDVDARGILAALEDGAALAALGITDSDQDAVEDAHDIIWKKISNESR